MNYEALPTQWAALLPPETADMAATLLEKIREEEALGKVIFPPRNEIFRAYHLTAPQSVRCVILGQDPYHEQGQAHGLAFSVSKGTTLPRSLRNMFKELQADLGISIPASGDLSAWSAQGVLLLNTVLSVEEGAANSHKSWGWQRVTQETLSACTTLSQPIVYVLWGKQAQEMAKSAGIDLAAANVIASAHPSPLSANRGFFGSRPYSKVNALLEKMGDTSPIVWDL